MLRMSTSRWMDTEVRGGRDAACGRAAALAVAIVCAVAFAACEKPEPLTGPDFLHVDIATSPTSLDPRFASDAISTRLDELIYDSMVRVDGNGSYVNDLAESVERPSPAAIIFRLRHGVRFSDGRELTARDVKYTYDSVLAPESLSAKRGSLEELKSFDIPDDYTIVMTTKHPYAPALELASQGIVPYGTPLPAKGSTPAPTGSGPFQMVGYTRDESLLLERNPYCPYPADTPRTILLKVVPDPTVR